MKIMGLSFSKISGERFSNLPEGLKINTKIDVLEIGKVDSGDISVEGEVLGIKFLYELDYSPKFAIITTEGNLLLALGSKEAKDVLERWGKKEMSEDFRLTIFNIVLKKAGLKALQLEEELNLPSHFQLPVLKKSEEPKDV